MQTVELSDCSDNIVWGAYRFANREEPDLDGDFRKSGDDLTIQFSGEKNESGLWEVGGGLGASDDDTDVKIVETVSRINELAEERGVTERGDPHTE